MKKHIKVYEDYLNESRDSEKLAPKISKAISEVDDSMSYVDFAQAVAQVLIDDYGKHNFDGFFSELKKALKLNEERDLFEEIYADLVEGYSLADMSRDRIDTFEDKFAESPGLAISWLARTLTGKNLSELSDAEAAELEKIEKEARAPYGTLMRTLKALKK